MAAFNTYEDTGTCWYWYYWHFAFHLSPFIMLNAVPVCFGRMVANQKLIFPLFKCKISMKQSVGIRVDEA